MNSPFSSLALIFAFTVGGVALKLTDFYGEHKTGYLPYIFAIVTAVCLHIIILDSSAASSTILGIVIGVTLAGKLDQLNMILGLVILTALIILGGLKIPDIPLLGIVTAASLIDEVGHDRVVKGVYTIFFRFRMILKIVIIILTILSWIDVVLALGFFCFDLSYDFTNLWLKREQIT